MKRHDWKLLLAIGHKYFFDCNTGLIAVADESGEMPESTSDGVMYLDDRRAIIDEDGTWMIPVRFPGGEQSKTPASWHEVVAVAHLFRGMIVEWHGVIVPIVKTIDGLRPRRDEDEE